MASRILFLKPWSADLDLQKEDFDSIRFCVGFPHLKLHYYIDMGLSKFASKIGRTLYTYKQTAESHWVVYARVCVELKVNDPRLNQIPYMDEKGRLASQKVEYEWIPPSCKTCTKFGHDIKHCPWALKNTAKWVPKANNTCAVQREKAINDSRLVDVPVVRDEIQDRGEKAQANDGALVDKSAIVQANAVDQIEKEENGKEPLMRTPSKSTMQNSSLSLNIQKVEGSKGQKGNNTNSFEILGKLTNEPDQVQNGGMHANEKLGSGARKKMGNKPFTPPYK